MKYSHQYIVAVTVVSEVADPDKVPLDELVGALGKRIGDILCKTEDGFAGDREAAFQHSDTYEIP